MYVIIKNDLEALRNSYNNEIKRFNGLALAQEIAQRFHDPLTKDTFEVVEVSHYSKCRECGKRLVPYTIIRSVTNEEKSYCDECLEYAPQGTVLVKRFYMPVHVEVDFEKPSEEVLGLLALFFDYHVANYANELNPKAPKIEGRVKNIGDGTNFTKFHDGLRDELKYFFAKDIEGFTKRYAKYSKLPLWQVRSEYMDRDELGYFEFIKEVSNVHQQTAPTKL